MDIDLSDYNEITQSEYRKYKNNDPANFHSYTARIGHKYFKKVELLPIIFKDEYYYVYVHIDRIKIQSKFDKNKFMMFNVSIPLLIQALEKWKEVNVL